MKESESLILVMTTTESADDAREIARSLIDEGLAACVQIDGPVTSHYRWEGELRESKEYRLMIKSSLVVWPALRKRVLELHSYEEPEIIMTIIDESSDGYRSWVIGETTR